MYSDEFKYFPVADSYERGNGELSIMNAGDFLRGEQQSIFSRIMLYHAVHSA